LISDIKFATYSDLHWYVEFNNKPGVWIADTVFSDVKLKHQLPENTLLWQAFHHDVWLIINSADNQRQLAKITDNGLQYKDLQTNRLHFHGLQILEQNDFIYTKESNNESSIYRLTPSKDN